MPALNLDYRTATRSLDWRKLANIADPREVIAQHDWVSKEPALTWLDGVPLGNGDMAAMYYGTPNRLIWLLNKGDIWDHRVPGNDSNLPPVSFRQISAWVQEQDWKSLNKIEERGRNLQPRHYPCLQPAAWIILEPIGFSTYRNFRQTFSMVTGEVITEFDTDFLSSPLKLTHYNIQTFLAADQNVLRIRIECERPLRSLRARLLKDHVQHIPDPIFKHRGTLLQLQCTFPDNLSYVIGLESDIASRLASQDSTEASIIFDDLEDTTLELRVVVACSETTASPEDRVRATLNVEKPQRYRGAIRRNQQAMEKYWFRSGLSWQDKPELERYWYLSQYLLGASTAVGKQAAGLQGLWNGHAFAPWHGGYRTDLHLQMNGWSAYVTNRLDMLEPYIRLFALELRDQMRTDTARHWGWGGVKVPLSLGPHGHEISTWLPAKLWPGGTAWIAIDFLRFWEYSSDSIFLTTVGYNFALECAEFLENWLFQSGLEKLEMYPSFCPNLGKGTQQAWVENPTIDIALYRTLFRKLIDISRHSEIREDPRRLERWQYILDHLPDYPVQNGRWMDGRNVDWKESHRYLSKMMAVYPLGEVSLSSVKNDFQVAAETLKGLEEIGFDKFAGFTWVWLALIYSRLGYFTSSLDCLDQFIKRYTRPNGLNRHYPLTTTGLSNTSPSSTEATTEGLPGTTQEQSSDIFQIDANLGFAAALNEHFMQWTQGALRIFPGLGKNANAQFWGWRTPGGHLVAAIMEEGKVSGLLIEATRPSILRLVSPFDHQRVTYKSRLKSKVESRNVANKKGRTLEFEMKAGQRIEFGKIGEIIKKVNKEEIAPPAETT